MRLIQGLIVIIIISATSCSRQSAHSEMNDSRILSLLEKMTIQEKIGQMHQVNGAHGSIPDDLKQAIIEGKIGSVLNEVNFNTTNELQRLAIEESRLGIPLLIGRDVIHGFKTIFPIPLGQAATWNPEITEKGARIAAMEASTSGVNWTFAPMIDISRDARWGRIAESFGEDPYMVSVMGTAMVKGFQGEKLSDKGSILACAKHFAGYGAAEGGRDYNTTLIPETELRNVYLPSFKAASDIGAGSFMSGFNDLNGVPASGNKFLLRKILREEWNYKGFVISDWASIYEMTTHGYAYNEKDAAKKAIEAGVDMEMVTTCYKSHLEELVEEGLVDEKLINEAVYRILKAKFDLGLFENPYIQDSEQNNYGKPEYLEAAKEAATQSFVLLKNENHTLPLKKDCKKIALIGPMAHQKYEQLGTWIFDADSSLSITPLEGLQQKLGKEKISFTPALSYSRSKETSGFYKAQQLALNADAIVLCVGEESILSGEAHCRAELSLPGAQESLIQALAKTGKPLILVVLAGRPLAIGNIGEYADAILYGFHPGTMTGAALADILVGDEAPSGKLPVTFPKSSGQIPIYYNHKNTGRPVDPNNWMHMDSIPINTPQTSLGNTSHYLDLGYEPLYPFGYGLSYSTFEYSQPKLDKTNIKNGFSFTASVVIKNTGNYTGTEVVQLYTRDLVGDITRPVKELKGFKRIKLAPGESKEVSFHINTSDLAFYNQAGNEVTEPGEFYLWIGGSSVTDNKTSFSVE